MAIQGFNKAAFTASLLLAASAANAATLAVQPLTIEPGAIAPLIVEGSTSNEPTFGISILVQLIARPGNFGTVKFTQAPPTDIGLAGDPWPGVGTFTTFDTDLTGSDSLNGSVDDNGKFIPAPLTYNGLLAGFPVIASLNASGTWDVVLSTTAGDSTWEGLPTTLSPSTISIVNATNIPAVSDWGMVVMALLITSAASILLKRLRSTAPFH